MSQSEIYARRDADSGKEKLKQAKRWGGSIIIPLTGYVEEDEYYTVIKKGKQVILTKVDL